MKVLSHICEYGPKVAMIPSFLPGISNSLFLHTNIQNALEITLKSINMQKQLNLKYTCYKKGANVHVHVYRSPLLFCLYSMMILKVDLHCINFTSALILYIVTTLF